MDAIFISDVHLKSQTERNGQTLLRFFAFLDTLPKPPTIFILGDLFDLWVSNHEVFRERYSDLISALQRLVKKGARLVYFEGNHDMHLAPFWKTELGAEVFVKAALFTVGGLTLRCEHGDEMNLEDHAYLRLRRTLRHPIMETLAHRLPGAFWDRLGQAWSRHSRVYSSRSEKSEAIRKTIREHAQRVAREEFFDVIISGHMHVQDDWIFEIDHRRVRSLNLGTWLQEPKVLCLENHSFSWRVP